MEDFEKENLYLTFKAVIESVIREKKENPKSKKMLDNYQAEVNLGLQMNEDFYFWLNLIFENGDVELNKGKLEEYDFSLRSAPQDMMFFSNGEFSILHMLLKKNQYGERKLRYKKGTTGYNVGKLLKLSKLLVLD